MGSEDRGLFSRDAVYHLVVHKVCGLGFLAIVQKLPCKPNLGGHFAAFNGLGRRIATTKLGAVAIERGPVEHAVRGRRRSRGAQMQLLVGVKK